MAFFDPFEPVHLTWMIPTGLLLCTCLLNIVVMGYRPCRPAYKGHPITVRVPRKGGWEDMSWGDDEFIGEKVKDVSIFTYLMFSQLSAIAVPLECRISDAILDHDAAGVDGYMQQETNHAVFQMIYNKRMAELGYPGLAWQWFWVKFASLLPLPLFSCFGLAIESGFVVFTYWHAKFNLFCLIPGPKWMWMLHMLEEAEHSWSSVDDILVLALPWRVFFMTLCMVLWPLVTLILPVIELFTCIKFTWRRICSPWFFVYDIPILLIWHTFLCFQLPAATWMHGVFKWRPSDETYLYTINSWYTAFKPYAHMLQGVAYVDTSDPNHQKLRRRAFATGADGQVVEATWNHDGTLDVGKKRQSEMPMVDALSKQSTVTAGGADFCKSLALRSIAYDAAIKQLLGAGLTPTQIKNLFMANPLAGEKLTEGRPSVLTTGADENGLKEFEAFDVAQHRTKDDCWIIVDGSVFNVTKFIDEHPGGPYVFDYYGGQDVTQKFEAIHSPHAYDIIQPLLVGKLKTAPGTSFAAPWSESVPVVAQFAPQQEVQMVERKGTVLNGERKVALPLTKKEEVAANVMKFTFSLPTADAELGIAVGQHVSISATINSTHVARSYTPTSKVTHLGEFELVVKVYKKGESYPNGGLMSQHLDSMEIGQSINVFGPVGDIVYEGDGVFKIGTSKHDFGKIGMIAGGTGITPMYQVIQHVREEGKPLRMSLLCANNTPRDVLLGKELADMAAKSEGALTVAHTVTQATQKWEGYQGRVTETMIKDTMPDIGDDTAIFLCGPPSMVQALTPVLKGLGYTKVFAF